MKKAVKSLLVMALALSASHLQAYTNKTYLQTRSPAVNLALENTAGWYNHIHRKKHGEFGGRAQAIFFFTDSTNDSDIGRYFGAKEKNRI